MTEKEKWNEILTQLLAEQDFVLIFGESNISFREEFKNFQSKFTLNLSSCNMQWDETSPSGSPKTAEIAPILVPAPSIDARLVKKWDSQAGALRSSPALSMVFKIGDKIWSMSKYLPTLWNHTIHTYYFVNNSNLLWFFFICFTIKKNYWKSHSTA